MKKILFIFAFAISALAQTAPNCNQINQIISTVASGTVYNNTGAQKCSSVQLKYFAEGFAALSLQVEMAPDNAGVPGAWSIVPAANVITGPNPATSITSGTVVVSGYFPWLRVNVTSLTGGPGFINYNLIGSSYISPPTVSVASGGVASTVTAIGPDAPGSAPSQPPVQAGGFDGTNVQRIKTTTGGNILDFIGSVVITGIDGVLNSQMVSLAGNAAEQVLPTANYVLHGTNGNWNRVFAPNANALASGPFGDNSMQVEKGQRWHFFSAPAVSTQATVSSPSGGAGVRNVVDCIGFSAGSTTAPALTQLTVNLRDGASGAGTVLASYTVIIPASTGQNVVPFQACGLNIAGTGATAMTLEFSALLTNLFENVWMTGYYID